METQLKEILEAAESASNSYNLKDGDKAIAKAIQALACAIFFGLKLIAEKK